MAFSLIERSGGCVPITALTKDRLSGWLEGARNANATGRGRSALPPMPASSPWCRARMAGSTGCWSGLATERTRVRRCGHSPGCRMPCRKGAIGSIPSRRAPIRPVSRSAGRSPPMPSRATTPSPRAVPRWSGPKAPIAAGSSGSPARFSWRAISSTRRPVISAPKNWRKAAVQVAEQAGACHRVIVGDELLAENYPTIHAVGRASSRPPRLVDIVWGDPAAPKVTLVGKGVCFDTGGLDLKTASGMRLMKKDMAGAAIVLGLAQAIMDAKLPVRLRVLLPCVENSVSGNAMRPLDIVRTRKGLTVEIGNTDAEGRLILCDALAEASTEKPELLIDMATLTGAARVALGPELAALFCNDDALARALLDAARTEEDPMWRMPLWRPYRKMIDSKIADLNNVSESPHAGAITAALYLQEFVEPGIPWAHLDVMAWNPQSRPGRPEGAEATALRALYAHIVQRFG